MPETVPSSPTIGAIPAIRERKLIQNPTWASSRPTASAMAPSMSGLEAAGSSGLSLRRPGIRPLVNRLGAERAREYIWPTSRCWAAARRGITTPTGSRFLRLTIRMFKTIMVTSPTEQRPRGHMAQPPVLIRSQRVIFCGAASSAAGGFGGGGSWARAVPRGSRMAARASMAISFFMLSFLPAAGPGWSARTPFLNVFSFGAATHRTRRNLPRHRQSSLRLQTVRP